MLVGIPHGSLDHLLIPNQNTNSKLKFYIFYVGLILLNLLIWKFSLVLGLLLFFFISSYHFGESQLFKFEIKNKLISHISYLFWGASVIFSFFFYNLEELVILSNSYEDTRNLLSNINLNIFSYLYFFSNAITIVLFIIFVTKLNSQLELFQKFLVCYSPFFFFISLICFTLFFIILHSLPSLVNQYNYRASNLNFVIKDFIVLMAPYSLLSILFILFIFFVPIRMLLTIQSHSFNYFNFCNYITSALLFQNLMRR